MSAPLKLKFLMSHPSVAPRLSALQIVYNAAG